MGLPPPARLWVTGSGLTQPGPRGACGQERGGQEIFSGDGAVRLVRAGREERDRRGDGSRRAWAHGAWHGAEAAREGFLQEPDLKGGKAGQAEAQGELCGGGMAGAKAWEGDALPEWKEGRY